VLMVRAQVISLPTQRVGGAALRIHYHQNQNDSSACRSTLVVLGVGTAMTETNYDGLGRAMAAQIHGAVEVIVNPGRLPLKQNPLTWNAKPFATVMNYWCLD
jgi:hypothetical protein